ncbi:PREDICTED: uncharacterized protein LOC109154838 [Ipomoea nil]|uniref:uncharacterized protein LOC109154838 n=1 Tax=Ipomoea nil TaxID=35883 RepID=UPI000901A15B|nr:PREDICTED: uncharacterized protein LOC109154838 [Ipomoea nil]
MGQSRVTLSCAVTVVEVLYLPTAATSAMARCNGEGCVRPCIRATDNSLCRFSQGAVGVSVVQASGWSSSPALHDRVHLTGLRGVASRVSARRWAQRGSDAQQSVVLRDEESDTDED